MFVSGQVPLEAGLERDMYEAVFDEVPAELTYQEKMEWIKKLENVTVSSDAFVSFIYITMALIACEY